MIDARSPAGKTGKGPRASEPQHAPNPARDGVAISSDILICLGLLALIAVVYWQVGGFEFVNYDDSEYVTENLRMPAGLTMENIGWAFRTSYFENWHPLTWLSYLLDSQLFGLNPKPFHLVNVLFHWLNSVLLFAVFKRMTGARWPSALVAALFAVHPLHVESVAWIAERKDVLSTFFGLLTLWAYVRYVEHPRFWRYLFALLFFALSLMSKAMLVTLPFVLLLLDFWPLKRIEWPARGSPSRSRSEPKPASPNSARDDATASDLPQRGAALCRLVEKIPFLVLTVGASIITYRAQHGARTTATILPLLPRIANAVVSYSRYLSNTIWPHNLSVYYPHPGHWAVWQVAGAALLLSTLTAWAVLLWRRRPYLTVGWLWYVGTLVPVIGLVQVGGQSMADRYMYVPMIGLLVMLAWGGIELAERWRIKRAALIVSSGFLVFASMALSRSQVQCWQNSVRLFEHALNVTIGNTVAHNNLGDALLSLGQTNDALSHFTTAMEIDPNDYLAHGNIGNVLLGQGKLEEAIAQYQTGLQIKPTNPELNHNLGACMARKGNFAEAIRYQTTAVQFRAEFADAYLDLGSAWLGLGKFDEAITNYMTVVRLRPHFVPAHFNLGLAFTRAGRDAEAAVQYSEVLRLQPNSADAHGNLAMGLARQGKNGEAIVHLTEAIRLNPNSAQFHHQLADTLQVENRIPEAVTHYRETLKLRPDSVLALNNLAWILATHADGALRNGAEAVRYAERACELSGRKEPALMGTLAAAYAETGEFAKAVTTAEKAIELATAAGRKELAATNQKLLELYRAGHPFREGKP